MSEIELKTYEIYDGVSGGAYKGSRYLAEAISSKGKTPLYSSILNEGIQFEPSDNKKGGIIVFSTDVNAEKMSENRFINFLKQKMKTISNRFNATKKIDKIAADNELVGWTIGHYLDGRYTSPKNGKQYGENSLSLEIIGVDFEKLYKIAMEICHSFSQESVLLKDYSSGRVLFIDGTPDKQMEEARKRFREIFNYNPKKGKLTEGFNDVDTTGWICIGEVPYYPWGGNEQGNNKTYIMVNPQKTMKWGKEIHDVRYTENNDGTGRQDNSIPSFYKQYITIYPEHQDDEYGEMFLGKKITFIDQKHQEFLSKLFTIKGKVILHHNSSYKITDGFIKKGTPNGYSNNTDIGIYFWGSRNSGSDPSNQSLYTYYCVIEYSDLYDFETNPERLTLTQSLNRYKYVGQYWKDGQAICVNTFEETPIWCILDKNTGQWYDREWKEIKKPFNQ